MKHWKNWVHIFIEIDYFYSNLAGSSDLLNNLVMVPTDEKFN